MINCQCGTAKLLQPAGAGRMRCPECRSFHDARVSATQFVYGDTYPRERAHFDDCIGQAKVRSLQHWLRELGLDGMLDRLRVMEVGFGGGFCLAWLNRQARTVYGIEVVPAAIDHAIKLGVPADRLLTFNALPERLSDPIDLWLFQDSFEHLECPGDFLCWMASNTASGGLAMIVAPEADCLSEKILGPLWPHRLPDHLFHWSQAGIKRVCGKHGFTLERSFIPKKFITGEMLARHVQMWRKVSYNTALTGWLGRIVVRFNIGEMGLLLRMSGNPSAASTQRQEVES